MESPGEIVKKAARRAQRAGREAVELWIAAAQCFKKEQNPEMVAYCSKEAAMLITDNDMRAKKSFAIAAQSFFAVKNFSEAAICWQKTAEIEERLELKKETVKAWRFAGHCYSKANKFKEAGIALEKAAGLYWQLNSGRKAKRALWLAMTNFRKANLKNKAKECQILLQELKK